MSGPIPGLCDAVIELYDGHGGEKAAVICTQRMTRTIEDAFFAQSLDNERLRDDRAVLALDVEQDGFHRDIDRTLITAFERLDEEVKLEDPSGTTAVVVLLKKNEAGDVAVKCAWCGDSRATMMRDINAERVFDLSVDHTPGSESEIVRIDGFYKALIGAEERCTLPSNVTGGAVKYLHIHIHTIIIPRFISALTRTFHHRSPPVIYTCFNLGQSSS